MTDKEFEVVIPPVVVSLDENRDLDGENLKTATSSPCARESLPDVRWVVGVDVGGTKIAAALIVYEQRSEPRIVCTHTEPTNASRGGEAVMGTIIDVVRKTIADSPQRIEGIGLGTTGCVDPHDGSVTSAPEGIMPGWGGTPVAKNLEREFDVPVSVLGDVQAHALGEARWGAARGCSVCLMVVPGTGLGGGIIVDGEVLRGAHGAAGEIGHTIHPAAVGAGCSCGMTGHTESVTAGLGIGALYQGVSATDPTYDRSIDGAMISRLAIAGDAHARKVLQDAGYALGQAMGSWANMLDPEQIILSGSVCAAGPIWQAALKDGYASQALAPVRDVPIVPAALGPSASLIGAAENLLDSLRVGGVFGGSALGARGMVSYGFASLRR